MKTETNKITKEKVFIPQIKAKPTKLKKEKTFIPLIKLKLTTIIMKDLAPAFFQLNT
jgi:hypothetical protein